MKRLSMELVDRVLIFREPHPLSQIIQPFLDMYYSDTLLANDCCTMEEGYRCDSYVHNLYSFAQYMLLLQESYEEEGYDSDDFSSIDSSIHSFGRLQISCDGSFNIQDV